PATIVEAAGTRFRRRGQEPDALFADAIALREAIYRMFSALAASQIVAEKDLALLNRTLAEAPDRETLARAGSGYARAVQRIDMSAAGVFAPVLWSAADLVAHVDRRRLTRFRNDQWLSLPVDGGHPRNH